MIVKRQFNNQQGERVLITTECDRMIRTEKDGHQACLLYLREVLVDEFNTKEMRFVWVMESGKTVDSIRNDAAPEFTSTPVKTNFQKVRAKMRLVKLDEEGREVVLETLYDMNTPEDQRFCEATPWGEIKLGIDNPPALAFFKAGQSFNVDFTIVDPAANSDN